MGAGNSQLEVNEGFGLDSTKHVGQSESPIRINRRDFIEKVALGVAGLLGLGKWATTRQTGQQLEPANPSDEWLRQHGSPAEQAGLSLQGDPKKEAQLRENPPKEPSQEEKAKIMGNLKAVNDSFDSQQ